MPPTQNNQMRYDALKEAHDILVGLNKFKKVTYTTPSPEEVTDFPLASVVGGDGPRVPADTQHYHFDHHFDLLVYIMWQEKEADQLALELEKFVKPIVDEFDSQGHAERLDKSYDMYVSGFDTDKGTMVSVGLHVAVCILTLTVLCPAMDAP